MKKYFNTSGLCIPDKHYMVNLETRLKEIKVLVDHGEYFVINRARQYGKTTILKALRQYLQQEYVVVFLSFQRMSAAKFQNETVFSAAFASEFLRVLGNDKACRSELNEERLNQLESDAEKSDFDLVNLFEDFSRLCETAQKPIVLMIDEIDSASNNQVFLDFLGQFWALYLDREESPTFQSVILAGVYDIKNLKQKYRREEEHRYNSPWNIAADFTVDMSFSVEDIEGMLREYECDKKSGMDIRQIAQSIYEYTSGYPYMVSKICKLLDEQIAEWTKAGVREAVKELLKQPAPLFDDMRKKIEDFPKFRSMMYTILFQGKTFPYNPDNSEVDIGTMFGFVKENNGTVVIANRIFETRLYNLFLSEEIINSEIYQSGLLGKNQFIQNGTLNMELVLQKFAEHFREIYGESGETFIEENGCRFFLLYLKPIINEVGNYYVEARTRDMRRTDVIVDYLGQQFIIEMKIWRGEEYNQRGEKQLAGYLEDYRQEKGYLLSFNFNKNKEVGVKEVVCCGKRIVEVVV